MTLTTRRVSNVCELDERLQGIEKALLGLSSNIQMIESRLSLWNHGKDINVNVSSELMQQTTDAVAHLESSARQQLDGYLARLKKPSSFEPNTTPDSIFDLSTSCEKLRRNIMSISRNKPWLNDHLEPLLNKLSLVGKAEELFMIHESSCPLQLPPRQLLTMACLPFFQSQEFSTDVFCQSSFWNNVDRIYSTCIKQGFLFGSCLSHLLAK
jgi:hypothetical protein